MIDHVLGRPSVKFRKIQVLLVVSFWSLYLYKGDRHGPPVLRRISSVLSKRLTAWQSVVITLLYLYVARNFSKVVGLESPEPLANLYNRAYFRATWVMTALDAGFWTAMKIRNRWSRDLVSLIFSVYYLFCAEQADEKVRKIRASLTVDHLRVSWNKSTTPYLSFFTKLLRPRLMRYPPRELRIARPQQSSYNEPVRAWLYFDGPLSALKKCNKVVIDIPGGGFVAMSPRHHDDRLMAWAGKLGLPIISLDYRKAPEYPYPYALNECYDTYHTIISSCGRCIGLSGDTVPKVVVAGDSAGGNLAVGLVLMVLESGGTDTRRWHGQQLLPAPEGVMLVYPALDMNIGNWMTDEQMALIRDRRVRRTNEGVVRRKSDDYRRLTPDTPHVSEDEEEDDAAEPPSHASPITSVSKTASLVSPPTAIHIGAAHTSTDASTTVVQESKPQRLRTRIAVSSMISYFNDRILTPEMMRSMIILYIGPHNRPDFATDHLLSPLLAPEALLARFPKTYFLTGERDPLVDDTVIFAGRIRQAKQARLQERKELGLEREKTPFWEQEHVEVVLVPGISHGFLQFTSVFHEGWKHIYRCSRWMQDIFERVDREEAESHAQAHRRERPDYFSMPLTSRSSKIKIDTNVKNANETTRHHRRQLTAESSGDEDRPLEMTRSREQEPPRAAPESHRGRAQRRGRERANTRNRSVASATSEDDLLGRRMSMLTGGLTRVDDGAVPPTP